MALIAAAAIAGAATLGSGIAQATSGGRQTTSTSSLEFPEETRRLFQGLEEPLLQGSFAEQANLLAPLLAGFRGRGALQQRFGAPAQLVTSAARRGATQAGISDFGPIFEGIGGLSPELIAALQQLTVARGAGVQAVVPPGFGQFLSPQTFTQQKTEGPSAFESGFQIAGSLAQIGGAYYGRG
jgi:hypothetical protein